MNETILKILEKIGLIKKLSLGDVDEKLLSEIDFEQSNIPNIMNLEKRNTMCLLCGGNLIVVKPVVEMNNMILCECERCRERFYERL